MKSAVLALALALGLLGCGPSSLEVKTARTAVYAVTPRVLLQIALEATQEHYKIGDINEATFAFVTKPLMFSSEGEPTSLTDGVNTKGPFKIALAMFVEIVEVGPEHYAVTITPRTLKFRSNNPAPQELKPDDADLPAFVTGRVETLAIQIYDRAKLHKSN